MVTLTRANEVQPRPTWAPLADRAFAPLVGLGLLAQLAAVPWRSVHLALAGVVVAAIGEALTWDEQAEVRGRLRRVGLGLLQRVTLRAVLVVAAVAAAADVADETPLLVGLLGYVVAVLVVAVSARGVLYLVGRVLALRGAVGGPNLGEHLDLHGYFPKLRRRRTAWYGLACAAEVPLAVGVTLVATGREPAGIAVLGATTVVVAAGLLTALVLGRRFERSGRVERYREALEAELAAHGAEVVAYFSGGRDATYQLQQWMPVLERLERPTLILLREAFHLETLARTRHPVLIATRHRDVETALAADPQVVLYVAQAGRNIHFLRYGRPKHVFLNHGDSDKVSSVNPVVKAYDRLFVAGQVAIDRYRAAGVDLDDDRFAIVGRPQLDDVLQGQRTVDDEVTADATGRTTVLYAPTWEGLFDAADYSSLEACGVGLVRSLLERDDVRLVFKPHPATGSVQPSARAALRRVEAMVRAAGAPHVVASEVPELDLLAWFDRAEVLVSDISAVVTDWLQTDKPYLVTNPRGLSDAEFRARFPSHTAAYVVAADLADLDTQLAAALGADPLAGERAAMKLAVLGDLPDGPHAAFEEALDEMVAWFERDADRIVNTFDHGRG